MYITNHLVRDRGEASEIYERITFSRRDLDSDEDEFFFCIMDETEIVGCATLSGAGDQRIFLEEIVVMDSYLNRDLEVGLLRYILFELADAGVRELLIQVENLENSAEMTSWLTQMKLEDEGGKQLIRIPEPSPRAAIRKVG